MALMLVKVTLLMEMVVEKARTTDNRIMNALRMVGVDSLFARKMSTVEPAVLAGVVVESMLLIQIL